VVKLETSNLTTLELDLTLWFELAQIQEYIEIQELIDIVQTGVGWVFVLMLVNNWASDRIYIYAIKSYFFKNRNPPSAWKCLKVNTQPYLMIDDFKILNIHNWTLPVENNNVRCLSKSQINNFFIFELCYFQTETKKTLQVHLAITNNQYAFSIVIGACTFK
jgi:hypothetical protein